MRNVAKKSTSRSIVRPLMKMASAFVVGGFVVLLRCLVLNKFDVGFVAAVVLFCLGGFFAVLALFASSWRGGLRARANKDGLEIRIAASKRLKENRSSLKRESTSRRES
jgi:Na+/melibiose symporter-like transporter